MLNKFTQIHLPLLLLVSLVFSGQTFSKVDETIQGGTSVSISDITQIEGDVGTSIFSFDVTLDAARDVTVDFATADGTASAGSDYTAQSGTVVFIFGGAVTQTVLIEVVGDTTVEDNETFFVNLSNPGGPLAIVDGQGLGTINNDDVASISIDTIAQVEGDAGTSTFDFTVSIDQSVDASVQIDTADGTATAGSDYVAQSQLVTFIAGGSLTQTFSVTVNGDTVIEPDETIFVNLSMGIGADVITDQVVATINNDDFAAISIDDVTQVEGNAGTTTFDFTLSIDQSVDASVQIDTANGTATAGSDYVALSSQVVNFTSGGSLTQTVSVTVNGDTLVESNETFSLNLSNATGAIIADAQGIGRISNDDFANLSINDVSQVEGDAGTTNFVFTISIDQAVNATVQVNSANGSATAGSDYTAVSQIVSFTSGGGLTQQVSVTVNGDTSIENNETFTLNLDVPEGAVIADGQGQGTIINDDFANINIDDVTQIEGNAGTTIFDFTLSIDQSVDASVQIDTANGTATAGSDYVGLSQLVNFTSGGPLTQSVSVTVNGDTTVEGNETFFVNLTNAMGATITDAQGQGTINNDDSANISINDVTQIEGNAGTTTFDFTVSIDQSVDASAQIDTADGTATAGSDYIVQSQVVNFTSGGALTQTFSVTVNGDTTVESNEIFFANISSTTGAIAADAQGQGTIVNDDTASISIDDVIQVEGDAGTSSFDFTVSIDQSVDASVQIDTANGTATAGSDYVALSQVVNFASGGGLTQTVSVTVNGDVTVEGNETFLLNLSSATGATITDAQGLGTISNDDSVQVIEPTQIPTNNRYGILLLMLFISVLSIKRYKEFV